MRVNAREMSAASRTTREVSVALRAAGDNDTDLLPRLTGRLVKGCPSGPQPISRYPRWHSPNVKVRRNICVQTVTGGRPSVRCGERQQPWSTTTPGPLGNGCAQ